MVVDPGLYMFHWSRQQAIDYRMESGRFTPSPNAQTRMDEPPRSCRGV